MNIIYFDKHNTLIVDKITSRRDRGVCTVNYPETIGYDFLEYSGFEIHEWIYFRRSCIRKKLNSLDKIKKYFPEKFI